MKTVFARLVLVLLNLDGKPVYNSTVHKGGDFILPVMNFSKGIYLFQVQNGDELNVEKLVIQ